MNDKDKNQSSPEIMGSYLKTALDMEDTMSDQVYNKFLNRDLWPKELNDETFYFIKKNIGILIQETETHKKMIKTLMNKSE